MLTIYSNARSSSQVESKVAIEEMKQDDDDLCNLFKDLVVKNSTPMASRVNLSL